MELRASELIVVAGWR